MRTKVGSSVTQGIREETYTELLKAAKKWRIHMARNISGHDDAEGARTRGPQVFGNLIRQRMAVELDHMSWGKQSRAHCIQD